MSDINFAIIKWARETAGLSLSDAVQKLGIKNNKTLAAEEKLISFENGSISPSRSILTHMSAVYRRPLLTFYLPHIPITADRGEDFRTLPEAMASAEMAQVDALLRNVKVSQELIKAALIDEDEAERLAFIGSISMEGGVGAAANYIAKIMEIQRDRYRRCSDQGKAFDYLRTIVEQHGVFVILKGNLGSHHTDIDVRAFRGFALADDIAPFIVINDHDSKAAWSFTLLHEVVHLFLGKTGISGSNSEQVIEKFCSDVASEILLPATELGGFNFTNLGAEELKQRINSLSSETNVSRTLIAYRLYRQGLFGYADYEALASSFRKEWFAIRDRQREKNKDQDGGPHPYIVKRHKLGQSLVGLVERLNESGTLPATKAALVLGIKPIKLYSFLSAGRAA